MRLFTKAKGDNQEQGKLPCVVEIERLLVDITPEAPSGVESAEHAREFAALEIKIKGTPEKRAVDGKIEKEAIPPNWREIQTDAFDMLTRVRDLRVAMFLIRAWLHIHGLAGLYTGLELLIGYIEGYWDTLYPRLDHANNGDPTARINTMWDLSLAEENLDPIKRACLFSPRPNERLCLRDIHIATGKIAVKDEEKQSAMSLPMLEAAIKECDREALLATREVIRQSMDDLKRLEALVVEKVGLEQAPDHQKLKTALAEMAAFFDKQLPAPASPKPLKRTSQRAGNPADNTVRAAPAVADDTPGDPSMQTIASRKDVIRILDQICAYYDQQEPASPVPLLLKRARQLVEKNFVEIVQDLAPEAAGQLKTLFGGYPEEK
jgi:type VI secretion system protein ImpA